MSDQTPDLAALEALAEAILNGWRPLNVGDPTDRTLVWWHAETLLLGAPMTESDAAFVAAADPQTVLWLIREVRRLQYEVSETQADLDNEREYRDLDHQTAELRADVIREEWQIARDRAEKAEATIARIEAMPVGPPSGGYFVVSMREVRAALDGGEPDA